MSLTAKQREVLEIVERKGEIHKFGIYNNAKGQPVRVHRSTVEALAAKGLVKVLSHGGDRSDWMAVALKGHDELDRWLAAKTK